METITAYHPHQSINFQTFSPGPVGSVGDVNMLTRVRTSCAAMFPVTFQQNPKLEPQDGSNVQDGHTFSYDSRGGPARVMDAKFEGLRNAKTARGYRFMDHQFPDKPVEPIVGGLPQFSFKNQVAGVYNAKTMGDHFMPLPGGYQQDPDTLARGGNIPRVTDISGPEETDMHTGKDQAQPDVCNEPWNRTCTYDKTTKKWYGNRTACAKLDGTGPLEPYGGCRLVPASSGGDGGKKISMSRCGMGQGFKTCRMK